jgi:hypothetical protein
MEQLSRNEAPDRGFNVIGTMMALGAYAAFWFGASLLLGAWLW